MVAPVSKDYPDVALSHMLVDNAAMQLVKAPKQFDVMVTGNMFGDILSGRGLDAHRLHRHAPVGLLNANNRASTSRPRFGAGHRRQGIANPLATILSAAMMLRYTFGREGGRVEAAVKRCWPRVIAPATSTSAGTPRSAPGDGRRRNRRAANPQEVRALNRVGGNMKKLVWLVGAAWSVPVLMQRMREENDFRPDRTGVFTTGNPGRQGADFGGKRPPPLKDAQHRRAEGWTSSSPVRAATTPRGLPQLRARRLERPLDRRGIGAAHEGRCGDHPRPGQSCTSSRMPSRGRRNWIGGNCTVSLMLMALGGLFEADLVEWMTSMTTRRPGAGAQNMRELLIPDGRGPSGSPDLLAGPGVGHPRHRPEVAGIHPRRRFPHSNFGVPLAGLAHPLDRQGPGQQAEPGEWKGGAGDQQDLGLAASAHPVDGCACASAPCAATPRPLTIKLKKDVPPRRYPGDARCPQRLGQGRPNQRRSRCRI